MFLTGFDALTLNTLFVDKYLQNHRLIQAFSRTNRIYNSVKIFGNIVCFNNLEDEVQRAKDLFSDPTSKDKNTFIVLKKYEEYYQQYQEEATILLQEFSVNRILETDNEKIDFIRLFNKILRLINVLNHFIEFKDDQILIDDRQMQDYKSIYQDLNDEFIKRKKQEKEFVNEDLVFELEFLKQTEITLSGILGSIGGEGKDIDPETKEYIIRDIEVSPTLRTKKELLKKFIDQYAGQSDIEGKYVEFIPRERNAELQKIIEEENLNPEKTQDFIKKSFEIGYMKVFGMGLVELFPKNDPEYKKPNGYDIKKERVVTKLQDFFERFYLLGVF